MTYSSFACEFATDSHLMKLQRLVNNVIGTIGIFPRRTPTSDLHMSFRIPNVHDYKTNYAGNKQKSYKIMTIKMFAIFDKENPDIECISDI
jgi:hypothetical protein